MTADAAAVRRRPKDRKQQILVQARDFFLGLGYPNISMAMIADLAVFESQARAGDHA